MIAMLVTGVLVAIVAGILLKNALQALMLIALVFGVFFLSCYAFDVSPRVILIDGVHAARHEYRAHRREIRAWL